MIGNNLLPTDGVNTQFLPVPADADAAPAATRQRVERLAGMMAMFSHLDNE